MNGAVLSVACNITHIEQIHGIVLVLLSFLLQVAGHETLRGPLAVGQTLLATTNACRGTEYSKHSNNDDSHHCLQYIGNWVFDTCIISYAGIRTTKVKTVQTNFTEEDILIISC
jgi:hypothetical protein